MNTEIDVKLDTRLLDAKVFVDLAKTLRETVEFSGKTSSSLEDWHNLATKNAELQQENQRLLADKAIQVNDRDNTLKIYTAFLPAAALEVFNLTLEQLSDPEMRLLFPALRAWCGFVEWSEKGAKEGFEKEFKKVDDALSLLRTDSRLGIIRRNIEQSVWNVIARNIRAPYKVSWQGKGESFSDEKHHAKSSSGTIISFVESALITLDGKVTVKADVETGTDIPNSIL